MSPSHELTVAPAPLALARASVELARVGVKAAPRDVLRALDALDLALVEDAALRALGRRGDELRRIRDALDEDLAALGYAREPRLLRSELARGELPSNLPALRDLRRLPMPLELALRRAQSPHARVHALLPPGAHAPLVHAELTRRCEAYGVDLDVVEAPPAASCLVVTHATPLEEARWAASRARELYAQGLAVELLVGPRSPQHRLLVASLRRLGLPFDDRIPRALSETAVGHLVLDAVRMAAGGTLPGEPWRERRLRRLGVPRDAEELLEWLDTARAELTAADLVCEPAEEQAVGLLRQALSTLADSRALPLTPTLVRGLLDALDLEPEPTRGTLVQVTSTASFAPDVPRLVLDASAARLPAPVADNPFLPTDVASRLEPSLGPLAVGLDAWLSAASLLRGPVPVAVSYAQTSGAELSQPSPLLEGLTHARHTQRAETSPASSWVERGVAIATHRYRGAPGPWTWDLGEHLVPDELTVTHLDEAASCGVRFALGSLLGIRPREREQRDLPASLLGTLAHRVLEDWPDQPLDPAEVYERLCHEAEGLAEALTGDPLALRRLEDLAGHLARVFADPELRPQGALATEVTFEVWWRSTRLRARIDRLEHSAHSWRILDYKLRASEPERWPLRDERRPVQLLAYAWAARRGRSASLQLAPAPTSIVTGYVLLRGRHRRLVSTPPLDDVTIVEEFDHFLSRLDSGVLELDPLGAGQPCRLCRRALACGVGERERAGR